MDKPRPKLTNRNSCDTIASIIPALREEEGMSILRSENVTYSYENKYQKNQVLKGISAEFERGRSMR